MENQELVPVVWENRPVVTTNQLAKYYGTDTNNINKNFNNNREHFTEGVHYFKLEGGALREFKSQRNMIPSVVSPSTACLYLWTEEGCLRHCKILDTKKAWEVFNELERVYFNSRRTESPSVEPPAPARKPISDTARVYAMQMSNALVKIGHTGDIADRISRVQRTTGMEVTKEHHSPEMPRSEARRIEKTLHRKYASVKVEGEFFNADFADVSDQINRLAQTIEINLFEECETVYAELSDYERGKLLIELIGVTAESPFKEQLARQTANLLLGREIF